MESERPAASVDNIFSVLFRDTVGSHLIRIARSVVCPLAGILWVVACSTNQVARPVAVPAQSAGVEPWRVMFHVSGGFAGLNQTLDLLNTGEFVATDRKGDLRTSGIVSKSELDEIASLIRRMEPVKAHRENHCRDCFEYRVEIQSSGRRFSVVLNDMSLPGTGFEALVKALMTVLDRTLTSQQKPQGIR